jgi:glycolate oxidase iron-sulfur subunit
VTATPDLRNPPCAIPDTPLGRSLPGILTCVHCGFCLQACPTYRNLGDENDSPRGRVLLMREVVEGELELHDPSFRTPCETACPSGVPYGHLLEAARDTMLREGRPLPLVARFTLWLFARPALLRVALAASRALRATRIPALLARAPGRVGFAAAAPASGGGSRCSRGA